MNKLDKKRQKIDLIDNELMRLLDRRFQIVADIGKIKIENNLKPTDQLRESLIEKSTTNYQNSYAIKQVYKEIFKQSKKVQKLQSYLVGLNTSYSYSKIIHEQLGNYYYYLKNINNLDEFIDNYEFQLLNITNPFKQRAYQLCDRYDQSAQETLVVNTIVKKDNLLWGYNTDYSAFLNMLEFYKINLTNKKIIIVGNGSTSKTILCAIKRLKCQKIVVLARSIKNTNEKLIKEYHNYLDYEVIINTTSYGVYPQIETEWLFDLDGFMNLELLIDINYNPYRSTLVISTKKINYLSGLYMLVEQARLSENIINNSSNKSNQQIINSILIEKLNIVLIGMPFSGKSTIAPLLASKFNCAYFDTDNLLQNNHNDLRTILNKNGNIKDYRSIEHNVIKDISLIQNCIIATGGGIIENSNNIDFLKANGIIFFLNPPLNALKKRFTIDRPLIQTLDQLEQIYNKRIETYLDSADYVISGNLTIEETVKRIEELFYEHINNKWS